MFFGWRVVWAAFVIAVFGWGTGYYGPSVLLQAVRETRGWSLTLIASAISMHFLASAVIVANLVKLHNRLGVVAVTRAAGVATAVGLVGWAMAEEPWQLFAATLLTGFGWAGTGSAAINAMVSPWFARRRVAALSWAFNGASIGGVLFPPIWVALIGALGFAHAAMLIGAVMALVLWTLSGRYLARSPAEMNTAPDGDVATSAAQRAPNADRPPVVTSLWKDRRFRTLAAFASLSLAAQVGLIAHLLSLLVPTFGAQLASFGIGLATACAILGRMTLGRFLPASADRRTAAAATYAVQGVGSLCFLAAGGSNATLLILGIVLLGLGIGNASSLPPLIAQQDFSPADTARVVAMVTACASVANAFAPAAFGLMRDINPGNSRGEAPSLLFLSATAVQFSAAAIAVASSGTIRRRRARS